MSTVKERTLGDGMDSSLIPLLENASKNKWGMKLGEGAFNPHKAVTPKGKIIPIVPKYVPSMKKPKYLLHKPKEPKFVPYEPYKCAMEPILQPKPKVKVIVKKDRNNVDIQDLVIQMSHMRVELLNKAKVEAIEINEPLISKRLWEKEKHAYENDIKNLKETNSHLENQLKFQAQVNSELKTLLVAAVGEDLETRVQHLTEDKLQLARALLNSANHLTSHQEQTEWLSGQCEVWRSKFLASSLMVEELARWKSALSKRVNDLQENIKHLLEERLKVRNNSLNTHNSLLQLHSKFSASKDNVPTLKSSNILELSSVNNALSANVVTNVFSNDSGKRTTDQNIRSLPNLTRAETLASRMLKDHLTLSSKPDSICNAVMEAAMFSTGQKFLQHPSSRASCCAHCKGEMEEV